MLGTYLYLVRIVLLCSGALIGAFFPGRPRMGQSAFFFLGAGFMLVETKGITELGLTFGNTWQVIGTVIAGVLMMAFLANCVVAWLRIERSWVPFLLLFASVALGLIVAWRGGFPSTGWGRLATVTVLTCPLFFSGIVFSTLLRSSGDVAQVMAVNLLGAMCGGLLEYNSMYFGFRSLYVLAGGLYVLALLADRLTRQGRAPVAIP